MRSSPKVCRPAGAPEHPAPAAAPPAVPSFRPRPTDRLVVSYPRSGNTWIRFLLANCLCRGEVDVARMEQLVPDVYKAPEAAPLPPLSCRLLKSHHVREDLDRHDRVVYLVRDPRSACVSYYYYHLRQGVLEPGTGFADYLPRWLDGSLSPCGPWEAHVCGWLSAAAADERIRWFRYEDLLVDPAGTLGDIVGHLGLDVDGETVAAAVRTCSLSALQRVERQSARAGAALDAPVRGDIAFIRRGAADEWRSHFTFSQEALLRRRCAEGMEWAGYAHDGTGDPARIAAAVAVGADPASGADPAGERGSERDRAVVIGLRRDLARREERIRELLGSLGTLQDLCDGLRTALDRNLMLDFLQRSELTLLGLRFLAWRRRCRGIVRTLVWPFGGVLLWRRVIKPWRRRRAARAAAPAGGGCR